MKVTMTIHSNDSVPDNSIEIGYSDLATIISLLPSDKRSATFCSLLRSHPASDVRRAVANLSHMDKNTLKYLAHDNSIEVIRSVTSNSCALKKIKSSLLLKMINRDVSVALNIALHLRSIPKKTRHKIIQAMMLHTDPVVVERVIENRIIKPMF